MEKIKKNCNGCKSIENRSNGLEYFSICSLGYGMNRNNDLFEYRPTQHCPKPRTTGELVKLINNARPS